MRKAAYLAVVSRECAPAECLSNLAMSKGRNGKSKSEFPELLQSIDAGGKIGPPFRLVLPKVPDPIWQMIQRQAANIRSILPGKADGVGRRNCAAT
jgi:hypothetical protein